MIPQRPACFKRFWAICRGSVGPGRGFRPPGPKRPDSHGLCPPRASVAPASRPRNAAGRQTAKDRTKSGRKSLPFLVRRVYHCHVGKAREPRSRGRRSRPAVLAVGLLSASLALAEGAGAQALPPTAPAAGAVTAALGQVSQQASQTAQTAVAQATAAQVQPTNVAAPVTVASPASTTAIAQANAATAGAAATNSSSTTQEAGQSKGAGAGQSKGGGGASAPPNAGTAGGQAPQPASGGASSGGGQGAGQAAGTAQNAGAQATTVQTHPVNIAIPITIGSPGASIVIVQTNSASSGSTAGNSSSTSQTSGQAPAGPAATLPGQPGALPQATAAPSASPSLPGASQTVVVPGASGTTWIWNWVWIWNWTIRTTVPSVQLPSFPSWLEPGGEARPDSSAGAEREKPAAGGRPALRPALDLGAPASDLAAAPPKASTGASSKIVQRPTSASEPALLPFVQLPVPPLPAPSAGSGFVPAGLLLGAVAMLVLYLGSLGLLFGRLSLASAPWRHQAYLTPQQRPG